jgi:hypothetical protein
MLSTPKARLALVVLLSCLSGTVLAFPHPGDPQTGWTLFHKNQRTEARQAFQAATAREATKADAHLGLALLAWSEGNETRAFEHVQQFYESVPNPYPYLYALWSTPALFEGSSGKKTPEQVAFLQKLLNDPRANGTMRAMMHATLGGHWEATNQREAAWAAFDRIGAVSHWQVLGTFDNTSASGFNKEFGALTHPEADATFKNKVAADVSWYTVPAERSDKWFDLTYYFDHDNSIMFAQTFLRSDRDQEVVLRSGCSGSMKIWLNDHLVTAESEERNCDLDIYANAVRLRAGYNRILVQIGESEVGRANFLLRFTDANGDSVPGLSSSPQAQPYAKAAAYEAASLPFFAEEFFRKRLEADPASVLDHLLLAETYLRNDKAFEARTALQRAKKLAPESTFVSLRLLEAYSRDGNETDQTRERETLKSKDPGSFFALSARLEEEMGKEELDKADSLLASLKTAYGASKYTDLSDLALLARRKKIDDMVKFSDQLYKRYPDEYKLVNLISTIESDLRKNPKKANAVLETYLKTNENLAAHRALVEKYFKAGNPKAGYELQKKRLEMYPYAVGDYDYLADLYLANLDYANALVNQKKTLEFAPSLGRFWQKLGAIYEAMNKTIEATDAYRKAIYFQPNLFEAHRSLRRLAKKPDLFGHFAKTDPAELYRKAPAASAFPNDHSLILLNETQRVVYPQGATEVREVLLVKVLTQAGIDAWKEYTVGFNGNGQRLILEKADLMKPDGSKITAETDENHLVFAGLQAGDAVYVQYRLEDQSGGKLAHHFVDRVMMNSGLPVQLARYSLLIPENRPFQSRTTLKPTVRTIEEFNLYQWDLANQPALQGESYMPALGDVVTTVDISTLPDWQFVSQWYTDLAATKAKADFEVQEAVKEIFRNAPANLTELAKARRIYEYILRNVNYLSVSFLQSALVPQKASRTLSTHLGDCKDLSTLFVTLCKEVGVNAHLVLVETRDNGESIPLPSIRFNHCIAQVDAQGKTHYVELTNSKNPFGALSPTLLNTSALFIPKEGEAPAQTLMKLNTPHRPINEIRRTGEVRFEQNDLINAVRNEKIGNDAADARAMYAGIGQAEQEKAMTQSFAADFANPVKVTSLAFDPSLDDLSDTVRYTYAYRVKNEVSEVAGFKLFRLPWSERLRSLDFIAQETRQHPFLLWNMVSTERMSETYTVTLPAGKKILELPANVSLSSPFAEYRMQYTQQEGKLVAARSFTLRQDVVEPGDYAAFREFFNKVAESDAKQIAFK